MKILQENIHVVIRELDKVLLSLEKKPEKTNPNTLKRIKKYTQIFNTSINETMHIFFRKEVLC